MAPTTCGGPCDEPTPRPPTTSAISPSASACSSAGRPRGPDGPGISPLAPDTARWDPRKVLAARALVLGFVAGAAAPGCGGEAQPDARLPDAPLSCLQLTERASDLLTSMDRRCLTSQDCVSPGEVDGIDPCDCVMTCDQAVRRDAYAGSLAERLQAAYEAQQCCGSGVLIVDCGSPTVICEDGGCLATSSCF